MCWADSGAETLGLSQSTALLRRFYCGQAGLSWELETVAKPWQ